MCAFNGEVKELSISYKRMIALLYEISYRIQSANKVAEILANYIAGDCGVIRMSLIKVQSNVAARRIDDHMVISVYVSNVRKYIGAIGDISRL